MERLHRMDGVRGLLALYVLLGHVFPMIIAPMWMGVGFVHGQAAVNLFFALSGLVIPGALARYRQSFLPFITSRGWRLLPVYFLALLLAIWSMTLGNPLPALPWAGAGAHELVSPGLPPLLWAHVLAHVTLLQGIIPQSVLPYGWVTLLGPAWSLSVEWQFYMLIGLLAPRHLVRFMGLLLGIAVFYRFLPVHGEFSRGFLPDQAAWFALGLASRLWLESGRIWPLVVCLVITSALMLSIELEKLVTVFVWAGVLLAQKSRWGAFLATRPILYLGLISYPIYLINVPVERCLALWLEPSMATHPLWFGLSFAFASVLGSLLLAALLHHTVEKPLYGRRECVCI